ncbi:MAG: hypothetical protein NUV64_01005 [Parcubacteria group bacterium]|nr:hypothetical protein [Parcubacteria group bacterium]MCR4342692.1 hypothetical protein [Patescibacteria group bacterium]
MINLLPTGDKIINKKDYLSRLFIVAGILVFSIIAITFALSLPIFFSLFFEERDLSNQFNIIMQGDSSVEADKIYAELDILNKKFSLYEKNNEEIKHISILIEKIIALKTSGIRINYFKYEKDKNDKIIITGESKNRSDFVDFRKKLEDDESFGVVSSPLSNLLKENDIKFTMTIEL